MLVISGVLLICFVCVQIFKPDTATIPPRIVKGQRSILAGILATMSVGSSMMTFVYFVPVWFQAIKGISALDSGIHLLPMVLPLVFASIATGGLTSKIGYYTPFMILGSILLTIGAGMLNTLEVDSGESKWIGYQVIFGLGLGCLMQGPNLAAQTVLPTVDIPMGTSLILFSQLLGGAVFIAVAQNVFSNQLLQRLSKIDGFDPALLLTDGATTLISKLPDAIRPTVLFEYNESLRKVFQVGLIVSAISFLGSISMEWKSVKKHVQKKDKSEGGVAEEGKAVGASEGEETVNR